MDADAVRAGAAGHGLPRAFIFDFDGTVVDSMGVWYELWPRYLAEDFGITAAPEDFEESESLSMEEECAFVHRKFGAGASGRALYEGLFARLRRVYAGGLETRPGARAFLEEARAAGIPVIVATSTPCELVESCIGALGLGGLFRGVVTTAEAGRSKDHPDVYHLACARVAPGAAPGEVWVFEDAMFGLRSAKAAGYRCVGVYDASGHADPAVVEALSDIYITSFEQLRLRDVLAFGA